MAESNVSVIAEFILKREKILADLASFKTEIQNAANAMDIKIPVGIADNFTSPLNAMKAAAASPVVVPVYADMSNFNAQVAGGGAGSAGFTAGFIGGGGGGRSRGGGGFTAPPPLPPNWTNFIWPTGGALATQAPFIGVEPMPGIEIGGAGFQSFSSGSYGQYSGGMASPGTAAYLQQQYQLSQLGAATGIPGSAAASAPYFFNRPLPRMLGMGIALHSVYRGAEAIGSMMDTSEALQQSQDLFPSDRIAAAEKQVEASRDYKQVIHQRRWATLGLSYGIEKLEGTSFGGNLPDADEQLEKDERSLKATRSAEQARVRVERQRNQAESHALAAQEYLQLKDLSPSERQEYEVRKHYAEGMEESKLFADSDKRLQYQRNLSMLAQDDILHIHQARDQESYGVQNEGFVASLFASGNTTEARYNQLTQRLNARGEKTRLEHGDVAADAASAELERSSFWVAENRQKAYLAASSARAMTDVEGEMNEGLMRFSGNAIGASRASLQRTGEDKVAEIRDQADAMGKLTETDTRYVYQQNKRAEADALVKKNALELAQFDANASRDQTERTKESDANIDMLSLHNQGRFGEEAQAGFEERQRRDMATLLAGPHTDADVKNLTRVQAEETFSRKGDIGRQAQQINLAALQNAAIINPALRPMAQYEALREQIIREQGDAAPENKDAVDELARVQIRAFEVQQAQGGWQGIRTFNGTHAMTDIVRQSEQISGQAFRAQKLKMIDDKLDLFFGDNLKSDLTNNPAGDIGKAIQDAISAAVSNLNIQKIGVVHF